MEHAYTTGFDGVNYDLLNPDTSVVTLEHVAKSLARKHRYNGFLDIPLDETYSVAQHSVYVGRRAAEIAAGHQYGHGGVLRAKFVGLNHDTPEFVLSDVITPLKRVLPDYREIEDRWEHPMYAWSGVVPTKDELEIMKIADHDILLMEMAQFGRNPELCVGKPKLFDYFVGHSPMKPSKAYNFFVSEWLVVKQMLVEIMTPEPLAEAV